VRTLAVVVLDVQKKRGVTGIQPLFIGKNGSASIHDRPFGSSEKEFLKFL